MTTQPAQPADPSARPTRVRWLVCILACGTSWLLYLHRYSWGLIKADIKAEFGLSDTQLGWLDSAFSASYALCQVPSGVLGDLLGPALVLPIIIFVWSGALAGMGAAGGFWTLAGVRTFFGVAQAGAYPNLTKVTRSWFPLSIRTSVQGLVATLAGRAGGACASLVVGAVLLGWLGLGWRAAMVWIAGAGVVFAVVFRLLFRDSPAVHPWSNQAERRLIAADGATARSGEKPKLQFNRHPAVLFSCAALLLQAVTSAFADAMYGNWIPLFLEEAKGWDKIAMGLFSALPLFSSAVGGIAGGVLNDVLIRVTGRRRFARSAVGFVGKLMAAALVVVSIGFEDGRWVMVALAGAKFFADWAQPTVWGTATDIGGRAAASVFAVINTASSVGAFACGPVIGSVKQAFGWGPVFWTIAGVYAVSGMSWLAIDCTRRVVNEAAGTAVETP